MRPTKAFVIAILLLFMVSQAIPPAFAWLWPILGFHNSCIGYPLQDYVPYVPLPGTPQWQDFPDSGRAIPVLPGTAYCPINGKLTFGLNPPFGLPVSRPAANRTNETSANETSKEEAPANETSTNTTSGQGWLTGENRPAGSDPLFINLFRK